MEEEKITQNCIELAKKIGFLKIENIKIKAEIKQENIEYGELDCQYKKITEEKELLLSSIVSLKEENKKLNELITKLKNSEYIRELEEKLKVKHNEY